MRGHLASNWGAVPFPSSIAVAGASGGSDCNALWSEDDVSVSESEAKSGKVTLLLAAGFSVVIAVVVFLTRPDGEKKTWEIDASGLNPGGELVFEIGKRPVVASVPKEEGATHGSFMISSPVVGYHSGPIERDGSLERIWVDDVTGDGVEDAVILVRSGGSGSYVEIFVLEGIPSGFVLRELPDLPVVGKPGYMGHDLVTVRDGIIHRSFPGYDSSGKTRVDQQWTVKDGLQGESPIKKGEDSNAEPSGKTVRFRYEYAAGEWKPVI